ncbi:hypothetical protein BJY00DRAFT_324883 [Aspergillus carlsbadensis]|nr:hypothetical protein BJY00DRAFT_324883 [Aspergillus carlsbadensis]
MSSPSVEESEGEDSLSPDFDATLCAALYNRIVHIGFDGSHRSQSNERITRNWFEVHRDDPRIAQCHEIIPESLASFLRQADIIVDEETGRPSTTTALVHHLQPLPCPEVMLSYFDMSDWEAMHEYTIILPDNNTDKDCDGVIMHLADLSVCYLRNSYDLNPGMPDDMDTTRWFDFQEVLMRLNFIVEVGKYRPVPRPLPEAEYNSLLDDTKSWEVVPWNDLILKETIDAWDGLVEAITARLPRAESGSDDRPSLAEQPPIADDSLTEEVKGFPRAFLTAAKRPLFKDIAPGLTIYDPAHPVPVPKALTPQTLTYNTPNPDLAVTIANHDALILFPADREQPNSETVVGTDVGLWICPDEGWADTVRLSLPYALPFYFDHTGHRFDRRSYGTQLWQHGDCPFFTQHSTRLVTLLSRWKELVEDGIWAVGSDGVEGGLEFYRQAEDPEKKGWFYLEEPCFGFEVSGVEIGGLDQFVEDY